MRYTHVFRPVENTHRISSLSESLQFNHNHQEIDSIDNLINIVTPSLKGNVIVDGGHYPIEQKELVIIHKPTNLTVLVFEMAVKLFKVLKNKHLNIQLGFLINDMGLDAAARKQYKEESELHPEYIDILNKNNCSLHDIKHFFYESTLRNRAAKKILKNGLKNGHVKEHASLLYVPDISDSYKEPSFENYIGHMPAVNAVANLPVPFCRAIMTQKLFDSEKKGYDIFVNLITEHEFKCLGEFAKVYHLFSGCQKVINIIFSPFELSSKSENYNNNTCAKDSSVYFLNAAEKCFIQMNTFYSKQNN